MQDTQKQIHTANFYKTETELPKIIKGEFSIDFETDSFNFTCNTQNVTFAEVEQALIRLRNEVQRQLDNKEKCPFHTEK